MQIVSCYCQGKRAWWFFTNSLKKFQMRKRFWLKLWWAGKEAKIFFHLFIDFWQLEFPRDLLGTKFKFINNDTEILLTFFLFTSPDDFVSKLSSITVIWFDFWDYLCNKTFVDDSIISEKGFFIIQFGQVIDSRDKFDDRIKKEWSGKIVIWHRKIVLFFEPEQYLFPKLITVVIITLQQKFECALDSLLWGCFRGAISSCCQFFKNVIFWDFGSHEGMDVLFDRFICDFCVKERKIF